MKLVNESQKEWLEKGGSAEALNFIDTVVGQLHTKAVAEGIVYKAVDEDVVAETATEVVEEVAAEVVAETPAVEEVVVAETKSVTQIDFATVLTETIFAAQKQYHDTVVAPLLAEMKSLKEAATVKAAPQGQGLFSFDMSSLLPSAAVASRIQKEFGVGAAPEIKGEAVKEPAITKKEVAAAPVDGNLLGSFLS